MRVLDLGTGSGILAIAAARMGADSVLALDIDPVAVRSARTNVKANRVDRVQVKRGTLSQRTQRENRESCNLALANITAKAICESATGLYKTLKQGGILIATGISTQSLDEVLITLAMTGFRYWM
jgi:ribosomal protein L11 methyltransferase